MNDIDNIYLQAAILIRSVPKMGFSVPLALVCVGYNVDNAVTEYSISRVNIESSRLYERYGAPFSSSDNKIIRDRFKVIWAISKRLPHDLKK